MKEVYNVVMTSRSGNNIYHLTQANLEKIIRASMTRALVSVLKDNLNVVMQWEEKLFPQAQTLIDECLEEERMQEYLETLRLAKKYGEELTEFERSLKTNVD